MLDSADVFISYAADTKPLAEELTMALKREGIESWADFKDLKPGQVWQAEVEHALERAKFFFILVSPHSYSSRWAEAEWRLALAKAWSDSEKVLVPVVVGGSESPPFLQSWVPLLIDPEAGPSRWTADVLGVLRSSRKEPICGKTAPALHARKERLDEMTRYAEALGKIESVKLQADSES